MLAVSYWAIISLATNLMLFVLFSIKFIGIIRSTIIPFLQQSKDESHQKWSLLQEKHLVLVAQKKQLATQFLQQEKQIALLTAKLEVWHLVCKNKEQDRQNKIADRAQAMNERAALQQYNVAQERLIFASGEKIITDVVSDINKNQDQLFIQYAARAQTLLSHVSKKDTVYESAYAKKTESA